MLRAVSIVVGICAAAANAGCLDNLVPMGDSSAPSTITPPAIPADAFATLKNAADAHAELCANDGLHPRFPDDADRVTRSFCQDVKPGGVAAAPSSLADLLAQLGLDFKNASGANGAGGNPAFALLGHSSALTARKVTSITPTAFVFTPPVMPLPSDFVALAFDPGELFVEIASADPTTGDVNFYLVLFDKDCVHAPSGCANADLLTSSLTRGWSNVRVYESTTALDNTIFDCRQCHAPVDANPMMLRMQENSAPFTHWFSQATGGGRALYDELHMVHAPGDDYGPIPGALVEQSDPQQLADLVALAGFATQPNAFDSQKIESELAKSGKSATWQSIYEHAVAGEFIATPYHDVRVTDPNKVLAMANAERDWIAGARADLPDLRDVFLDRGLRDMGFAPKLGLDGRALLVEMCQQCHDRTLDPTITRDRFLVDELDQMPRAEKDLAIERLRTPLDTRLTMPPPLFRTITDDERNAMIAELMK